VILDKHPDYKSVSRFHEEVGACKALGYWSSNREPELPDPSEFVGEWDGSAVKAKVVEYVKRAPFVLQWRGSSYCRFKCGKRGMGSTCLTDGVYVWPEGFYHYLEEHDVVPPPEFIEHVLSNPGLTRQLLQEQLEDQILKSLTEFREYKAGVKLPVLEKIKNVLSEYTGFDSGTDSPDQIDEYFAASKMRSAVYYLTKEADNELA
jgi:hypothetical protein